VILVTGASGFVGRHVVQALLAAGQNVRALVRDPKKGAVPGCELVQGDMTDASSLRRAVEGVEGVVHLVAVRQGKEEKFQRVMAQGGKDLVTAAREAGVKRFLLMSALGTREENVNVVPYFRAKWEVEQLVKGSGIDHVIFQPSLIFGPDGGIIPTFRKLVKLAPVTPIIGSGERKVQPIWVDDMAAYFVRALDLQAATNRAFEVGGPEAVTWNEFWVRFRSVLGVRRRPTIHVPVGLMRVNALLTERLPGDIPLTRDLLTMLEHEDNVVTNDEAVETFQIPLVSLDEQLRRLA
jgi:NADH dehydrogenase